MLNRLKFKGTSDLRWIHFILDKCQRPTQFLLYKRSRESHESGWGLVCVRVCACVCVLSKGMEEQTSRKQYRRREREREKTLQSGSDELQTPSCSQARWVTLAGDQLTRGASLGAADIYGSDWLHITDQRSFLNRRSDTTRPAEEPRLTQTCPPLTRARHVGQSRSYFWPAAPVACRRLNMLEDKRLLGRGVEGGWRRGVGGLCVIGLLSCLFQFGPIQNAAFALIGIFLL